MENHEGLIGGHMGVPSNQGYHFGGLYKKDYSILDSILGSTLGSLYLGKLPYRD